MARLKILPEHLKFLAEHPTTPRPELTDLFNSHFGTQLTLAQITAAIKNNKLPSNRPKGFETGKAPWAKIQTQHLDFLREHYPKMDRQDLTDAFNKKFEKSLTVAQITSALKNHKIKSGRTGHYNKGHVPWSAGKAGTGLLKPNSGCFKKGEAPLNTKPLGHEYFSDGYIWVKVAEPNPWKPWQKEHFRHKHVVIWEQVHGPVPEGMALIFKDSNNLNCVIENLELVSRQELLRLNKHGYRAAPEEMKTVVRTLAKLEVKMFALKKSGREE